MVKKVFVSAAIALAAAACQTQQNQPQPDVWSANYNVPFDVMVACLAAPPTGLAADKQLWSMVTSAYGKETDTLLWVDRKGPRANLAQLRQAFANAAADGLDPGRYDLSAADALLPRKSGLLGARLEPSVVASATA